MFRSFFGLSFVVFLIAVSGQLRGQDTVVYTQPPLGGLAFEPMVYYEGKLLEIEDVFRGSPVVRIDGKKKTLRRPAPSIVFVPTAQFSDAQLVSLDNLLKTLDTTYTSPTNAASDRGVKYGVTVDRDLEQVMGVLSVEYGDTVGALYMIPFKVTDLKADEVKKVTIPVPRPREMNSSFSFTMDFFLHAEDGPILGGATRRGMTLAEESAETFFGNVVEVYLDSTEEDTKMKVIHSPLPISNPGQALKRILFQTTFSEEGRVERVQVDMTQGPSEVILAGIQALFGWRTLPAVKEGQPVSTEVMVPIELGL